MEGEVQGEDELLRKLRDSRRRFQRRMQQLIEKYNQPFEDAPVVQMSTLTYETPQGTTQYAGSGEGKDTGVTLVPSLASPTRPPRGYCGGSEESLDGPVQPPSSPREGDASSSRPAGTALAPRSDSVSFPATSGSTLSSSLCSEADNICNATLSDLYAGMLHSMSRLLGTRPSCIISTKTFICQNWSSRRRHRCKSRMNRTGCRGGGRSRRSPQERRPPLPEPGKHTAVLRDCENLLDVSGRETGLELGQSLLDVRKPHTRAFAPGWKGLRRTPPKLPSLTYLDSSAVHHLDQENRFMTLRWLISPVKIAARPRILQGGGRHPYREIEIRFDKLHQEYCSSPRKQPGPTDLPGSLALDVYRGGPARLGGPRGLEARRLSSPLLRAKAKRLSEAFENLGQGSVTAGSCLPKSNSFPLLSKTDRTHSPGHPEHTSDLGSQEKDPGQFRSVSLSKAISVPRAPPPGWARDRYDDIKEKFNKLHQKCCPESPQRTQAPSGPRADPGEARVGILYQKEDLGKFGPDSGSQGPQKPSPPRQWSRRSPLGSIAIEAPPSADFALAARGGHEVLKKRRRLSDPQVCVET
uniref:Holliday junction recognition protein n=1 Tax=Catagonus wagneri TaxID=51154 RepID=A0A8C3YT35_9CETA